MMAGGEAGGGLRGPRSGEYLGGGGGLWGLLRAGGGTLRDVDR